MARYLLWFFHMLFDRPYGHIRFVLWLYTGAIDTGIRVEDDIRWYCGQYPAIGVNQEHRWWTTCMIDNCAFNGHLRFALWTYTFAIDADIRVEDDVRRCCSEFVVIGVYQVHKWLGTHSTAYIRNWTEKYKNKVTIEFFSSLKFIFNIRNSIWHYYMIYYRNKTLACDYCENTSYQSKLRPNSMDCTRGSPK